MRYLELDSLLDQADLVITAEGSLDAQTPFGKVPTEVARRAKERGLPVIAFAGRLGEGVTDNLRYGIDAFSSIQSRPCSIEESMLKSAKWLTQATSDAMRLMAVGFQLKVKPSDSEPADYTSYSTQAHQLQYAFI